ncbi:MAG: AmmeMemoRadiSam system radical SAM enzyme, partial [candidate division Zixibacteria bacterium]|nr:AmmeMemoRadiSam system radical SAM enzyme [candidate division Zixibacteria bacterium]
VTDAFNIDLKGIHERFYRLICKGQLAPVMNNIRRIAASGAHLEVTNLIIPRENDSDEDIAELIAFVASVSDRIPLHFSAYHPDYKLRREYTSEGTLLRAQQLARAKLKYVYLGNIGINERNDTHCPDCGYLLVTRAGFRASVVGLSGGNCSACGAKSDIRA